MAGKGVPPHLLQLISDMAAEGLTLEDISTAMGMTLATVRKYLSEHIEASRALKEGQERHAMVNGDSARRSRLGKLQANFFIPDNRDLATIEDLARLGWSEVKIAEQFDVTTSIFMHAKRKFPDLEAAIKRGQLQSEGRRAASDLKVWKPNPDQLERIADLASQGLTLDSIAAEMNISPVALYAKRDEVPEIDIAYRTGFAKAKATLERKIFLMASNGNDRLLQFWLKTRDKENYAEAPAKASASTGASAAAGGVLFELPKPAADDDFEKESEKFRRERRIAEANK